MTNKRSTDPVDLTARLIQCPSVTPEEAGALVLLEGVLSQAGFTCTRVDRNGIPNLFARWGPKGAARTIGFNGHTDVVPPGDPKNWSSDPFGAEIRDGKIWGRGAADMKSGVAAFAAAAIDFAANEAPNGAIVLAITGDEEGTARDGTRALLDWISAEGEAMDVCLVGEPTCPDHMGQMIKIGRRGSLTAFFTANGVQGHSAYPHRARNPVTAIAQLGHRLSEAELDRGTEHFDPSTLALTTIDTGNPATNVIPAEARLTANIRFNDTHTAESLTAWMQGIADQVAQDTGVSITLETAPPSPCFLTAPGALSEMTVTAVREVTGVEPELSTSGGTSDARFVKDHCPVVEVGLVGRTMHQVDEHVEVAHIHQLKAIYAGILRAYFA